MQPTIAIGYVRVSTDEQADSGAGLAAQRDVLAREAARRGWALTILEEDGGVSAGTLRRPALIQALDLLDRREADVLVVAKLDRLSRSVADFGLLLERAKRRGWSVVCLDLGVDTTTPVGEFTANVVAAASQYERRLISQRTKEALAARRRAGVRLGCPPTLNPEVVLRINDLRREGRTLRAIAALLTSEGQPTARGGSTWSFSTIASVLNSQHAERVIATAVETACSDAVS